MAQAKESSNVSNFYHDLVSEIRLYESGLNPTAQYAHYKTDILGFFRNELHIEPSDDPGADQVKILLSIQDAVNTSDPEYKSVTGLTKRRKAIRSGHKTGKTAIICAGVTIWWACIFHDFKVVTTAPTWRQVYQLIWPDIHRHLRNAPQIRGMFDVLKTQIIRKGHEECYAVGANSDDPISIAGYHESTDEGAVLVIVDESAGVKDEILDAVKAALASDISLLITVGNPLSPTGFFRDAFHTKKHTWDLFQLNSEKSRWVSKKWIEECKEDWGEDSSIYKARVKGEFSDMSIDQLIALSWIDNAINKEFDEFTPSIRGVSCDVASMGTDFTVYGFGDLDEARDLWNIEDVQFESKKDPTEVARILKSYAIHVKANFIIVDATGLGEGVYSNLKHDKDLKDKKIYIIPFKSAKNPLYGVDRDNISVKDRYTNLKAQGYWHMSKYYRDGKMSIPDHNKLTGELSSIRWEEDNHRRIKIIDPSKSPDFADFNMMLIMAPKLKRDSHRKEEKEKTTFNLSQVRAQARTGRLGGLAGHGGVNRRY